MARPRVRREDLKPGEVLCSYCTAKCCRYFALPIETPTAREDYDSIRWYIMHGRTAIFVEDDSWYLMVYGDCKHLLPDYRCGIYNDRPKICRSYSTDNCEYDDTFCYDKLFETSEQVWEYAEAVLPPAKTKRSKSAKRQTQLPVLNAIS